MHGAIAVAEQNASQSAREGRWYVFLVMAGMERRACSWLRQHGLDPYWPRYEVGHRDFKQRRKMIWRSVLPGYLFIPTPVDCGLVEEAPGVHRFIRYANRDLAELDGHDMNKIREIEAALADSVIAARDGIPFKVGQAVHIIPLDINGEIQLLDSKRRIVVSVPLFGGSGVPMIVSVADIESI